MSAVAPATLLGSVLVGLLLASSLAAQVLPTTSFARALTPQDLSGERLEALALEAGAPLGLVLEGEYLPFVDGEWIRKDQTWPVTLRDALVDTTLVDASAMGFRNHVVRLTARTALPGTERVSLHRITGPSTTLAIGLPTTDWLEAGQPHLRDLDGDGEAELLLLVVRQRVLRPEIAILKRNGSAGLSIRFLSVAPGLRINALSVGDYDGDGRQDVAAYCLDTRSAGVPNRIVTLALQLPGGGFVFGVESTRAIGVRFEDLCSLRQGGAVGDHLVLSSSEDEYLVFALRAGTVATLAEGRAAGNFGAVAAWDADGDGRDALLSWEREGFEIDLRLHPETLPSSPSGNPSGNPLSISGAWRRRAPLHRDFAVEVLVRDFDRDGFDDLLHPQGRSLRLVRGGHGGALASDEGARLDGTVCAVVDWEGDGDQDLVLSQAVAGTADRRSYALALNDGGGFFSVREIRGSGGTSDQQVSLVDLDGDGTRDLITGPTFQLLDAATLRAGPPQVVSLVAAANGTVITTDLDGDGLGDILVSGGRSSISQSGLVRIGADALGAATPPVVLVPEIDRRFVLADFNGDGRLDIAGTRTLRSTAFVVALQVPGAPPRVVVHPLPPQGSGPIVAVDFDQDGDRDVLAWDTLWVNDGAGAFQAGPASGLGLRSWRNLSALDLDGDGDEDLITAELEVWINRGGPTPFTSAGPASSISAAELPRLAPVLLDLDLDQDGDDDLLTAFGVRYALHRHLQADTQPRLGRKLRLALRGEAAGQAQLALSPIRQDRDLGSLGILRLATPILTLLPPLPLGLTTGQATLEWAVPNDPALTNRSFWAQALLQSPTGLQRLSNALELRVQAR